jgi:hypothetical protein
MAAAMNSLTYTVRIPGQQTPVQMEFAQLKNAYADGNIPGTALVTLEHQDFWYPLAELMGDAPTKPLLFPCGACKQMVKSRWIDRGNPVKCPKCHGTLTVPNPEATRAQIAVEHKQAKAAPFLWLGVGMILVGIATTVFSYLQARSESGSYAVVYGLVLVGFFLVMDHWFDFRGKRKRK